VRLYKLGIQLSAETAHLNIGGVRRRDVDRLLTDVLQLESRQWTIRHWTRYERFVVLTHKDAADLANRLDPSGETARKANEKAREEGERKEFLVDLSGVATIVGRRATAALHTTIYRVVNGVTAVWKLECALSGSTAKKNTFTEAEAITTLDAELDKLTEGLNRLSKPKCWEPVEQSAIPFEACIARLRTKAYRGKKPVCNTPPSSLKWYFSEELQKVESPFSGGSLVMAEKAPFKKKEKKKGNSILKFYKEYKETKVETENTESLKEEIVGLPLGTLSEVVFPPEANPHFLIQSLKKKLGDQLCFSLLAPSHSVVSHPLAEAILASPQSEEVTHLLIWVDEEIVSDFDELCESDIYHSLKLQEKLDAEVSDPAFSQSQTWEMTKTVEELWEATQKFEKKQREKPEKKREEFRWEAWSQVVPRRVSSMLAGFVESLRQGCEQIGFNVTLISWDCRPQHGRGNWKPYHRFTDARVRSLLGDAGRHFAHQRYLVERDVTTVWKDEVGGAVGRFVCEQVEEQSVDAILDAFLFEEEEQNSQEQEEYLGDYLDGNTELGFEEWTKMRDRTQEDQRWK